MLVAVATQRGVLIGGGGYMTDPPPLVPGRSPVMSFS